MAAHMRELALKQRRWPCRSALRRGVCAQMRVAGLHARCIARKAQLVAADSYIRSRLQQNSHVWTVDVEH